MLMHKKDYNLEDGLCVGTSSVSVYHLLINKELRTLRGYFGTL